MRKKKSGKKKIIITTITLILLWLLGFYLYVTYNNIEIYDSNYTTQKTQSTIEEQTVEKAEEESKKVADIIEETIESVVGISKLKNTGTSITLKQVLRNFMTGPALSSCISIPFSSSGRIRRCAR